MSETDKITEAFNKAREVVEEHYKEPLKAKPQFDAINKMFYISDEKGNQISLGVPIKDIFNLLEKEELLIPDKHSESEPLTLEKEIDDLEKAIHNCHLHRLLNLDNYMKALEILAKGESDVRGELGEKGLDKDEVKRLSEMAKCYVNEKNIIREIRYAVKLIDVEEQRLRDKKAEVMAKSKQIRK